MRKESDVIRMIKEQDDNGCREKESESDHFSSTINDVSTLTLIQKTVQHFATLLANVLQLEVEVVDNRLHRIAGTGIYGQHLGETPESNTVLLSKVIDSKQDVVIFDSRRNVLCQACEQRDSCLERGFVGVPVLHQQRCLGVISLVAVNNVQLRHLREHTSMFIEYIRHISSLLVENIREYHRRERNIDPLMVFLIRNVTQGVILLDDARNVTFINDYARSQLNIPPEQALTSAVIAPVSEEDECGQDFTLCLDGTCWRVSGRWQVFEKNSLLLLSQTQQTRPLAVSPEADPPVIRNFIGNSRAMRKLKAFIGRIAASPSSVMILGESGTGKEVVARSIHRLSPRHDKPFVAINCAAIPENLLESELFGYVKGAFTGAAPGGKKGLIQLASGGSLFLDEIGDMPLALQVRLLRAIEGREVMPIGASQPVPVDIRIISATHQNLADKIQQGAFREDLYYRLNVIPAHLPPLREREGDIVMLLEHFLASHARRIGRHRPAISPEVIKLLNAYRWPGNVRELSNLVEYLINIVPEGEVIESSLLPPVYHTSWRTSALGDLPAISSQATITLPAGMAAAGEGNESPANLKSVEKTLIEEALLRTRNKKQVADELGIGVATLYRKIKKYGLNP